MYQFGCSVIDQKLAVMTSESLNMNPSSPARVERPFSPNARKSGDKNRSLSPVGRCISRTSICNRFEGVTNLHEREFIFQIVIASGADCKPRVSAGIEVCLLCENCGRKLMVRQSL